MAATSLADQTALKDLGDGRYESIYRPEPMGNNQPIAYGGCTIGIAIRAACETVPEGFYIYSAQGNFLGPSQIDRNYMIQVHTYRQTKSFVTRRVDISQQQDNGKLRPCMTILADFHVREKNSVLEYSSSPTRTYSSIKESVPVQQVRDNLVQRGVLSQEAANRHAKGFALAGRLWEGRFCPESVGAQNLYGIAKDAPTTQDHLKLPERTSAEWFRSPKPLQSYAEHAAGLGLILDAALAFMPLMHNKQYLDEVGACSTLDFSLRLFGDIDLNDWNLRELKTVAGGNARTFSQCQVWNKEGRMVASMTQSSILRPKL